MKNFAELEVILFSYGEPISLEELAKLLEISLEECQDLISQYKKILEENEERGLTIIENNEKVQLVTKPKYSKIIEKFIKEEFKENLTPASLEVLALVAYLGPISRSMIDQIRGVNSSFILRNLLIRGLIEKEERGNVYFYQISHEFLKHLGLTKKEELLEFEKYKNILNQFKVEEDFPS